MPNEESKPDTRFNAVMALVTFVVGCLCIGCQIVANSWQAPQESPAGRPLAGTLVPSRVTLGTPTSVSTQEPLRSFELPKTSPYQFVYTGSGAGQIPSILRTTSKYRLWVPMSLTSTPNLPAGAEATILESLLQEAFREVETILGRFTSQVEVYIVDEIPHRTNANKSCLGIAWWEGGKPHMAIRARSFSVQDTVAVHELVHLRIEERGFKIPVWLEEGFCHYFQAADNRSETCLPRFETFANVPSYDDLAQAEGEDWNARAMGWALVHFWVKEENRSLESALALGAGPVTGWPSPEIVRA